jgi:hypothetical protein
MKHIKLYEDFVNDRKLNANGEIKCYSILKEAEKSYIKTDEILTDIDYDHDDVEYKRTKAYKIEYHVNWMDLESSSDPDIDKFNDIDEAYKNAQLEGDWLNGNITHIKTIDLIFKECWLNSDGSEYDETGKILNIEEAKDIKILNQFIVSLDLGNNDYIYEKDFGKRDDNVKDLEAEVYNHIGKDLERTFITENGQTYKIIHAGSGKYSKLIIEDTEGEEIDSIKLRISDHTYNPSNNDDESRNGKFISIEIANVNSTKNKYKTRYSLSFNGENTYSEVLDSVNDRIDDIIKNLIKL